MDTSGSRCVSVVSRLNDISIGKKQTEADITPTPDKGDELGPNVMDRWEDKGVTYKSNGAGNGGRIENSYLIKEYADIYEYSDYLLNKSEYQADFSGSVEGVVFEWDVHNKIYYYGPSKWENNAKDVDLGRSIFSDSHEGLNIVMWFSFFLTYPEQYYADLFS